MTDATDAQEHLNHNYIVRVKEVSHIRGLLVKFPKNILLGLDEDTFVYEITSDAINIFSGGVKVETVVCPEYAARFLVSADVSIKMRNRKISSHLIAIFTTEDELVEIGNVKIINIIMGSDNSQTCDLEAELEQSLKRYSQTGDISDIDELVVDGFELISSRYIRGTSDE